MKIEGAKHEFDTIAGVKEDVVTIILNLKRVRLALHGDGPVKVTLKKKGDGVITAKDLDVPSQVEILSPDQRIAEITDKKGELEMEITIDKGLGYVAREVHAKEKVEIGTIALDAVFTPIRRANYEVENMRVGDRTDYNRLRMIIETDGTMSPREALEESIEIMIHQLKAVIGFQDSHKEEREETVKEEKSDEVDPDVLKTRIETLELSSRTLSALEEASIRTIGGLVRKKKDDILALDGIGPKGVEEIENMLTSMSLTFNE